jgi:hypothetical protein
VSPSTYPHAHLRITPTATQYIYAYDILFLVHINGMRRRQVKRSLRGAIDDVFRALKPGNDLHLQEPMRK